MHAKSRETDIHHKIAILATGDEVVNGDILNTNTQEIAMRLTNAGMQVRTHMAAPDTVKEIHQAIAFLLKNHEALIITGGLGPTSDDLTRYALSEVINRPLQFDNNTWEEICSRLKRFGYSAPPESNRQQALFPEGAIIIPNPNGTAAGCSFQINQQFIFMLPGPPTECLPLLDNTAIPALKNAGFQQVSYHKKWLLLGASEGKLAEELDSIAKPFDCITGYRLFYPYIEFKIHSNKKEDFDKIIPLIEKSIKAYLTQNGEQTASIILKTLINESQLHLNIDDHATGGALQAALESPATRKFLHFSPNQFAKLALHIEVQGLTEYWEQKNEISRTQLRIHLSDGQNEKTIDVEVPFRGGTRVIHYAVEFICSKIYTFLVMEQQTDSDLNQN
jgi:nicotinamide-nucleotide amidase